MTVAMKARASFKRLAYVVGIALSLTAPSAIAQQGTAPASALIEQGRQLYATHCLACHQAGGTGTPPAMPALAGNAKLADTKEIVRTIRLGRGGMLAFPNLSATEIAAVATYVRTAWDNQHGAVAPEQATAIIAGLPKPSGKQISVWSGVYTDAQNKRGEEIHSAACAQCHGLRLNGAGQPDQPPSPAIARASFLRKWSGQSVAALLTYIRTRMPPETPGSVDAQQSIDAIAHMLAQSNIPAGASELPAEPTALADIVIEAQPAK